MVENPNFFSVPQLGQMQFAGSLASFLMASSAFGSDIIYMYLEFRYANGELGAPNVQSKAAIKAMECQTAKRMSNAHAHPM